LYKDTQKKNAALFVNKKNLNKKAPNFFGAFYDIGR